MSQTVGLEARDLERSESPPTDSESVTLASPDGFSPAVVPASDNAEDGYGEFSYRPVPILAPVAAVIGVASLAAWWSLLAVGVAFLGVVVGLLAVRRIVGSEGEYGGFGLAMTGFVLASTMFLAGTAKHAYVIATEVPEGYRKVNFARDIAAYGLQQRRGTVTFAPQVADLFNEKLFVKGYMWQTGHKEGLTSFLLVKDNQICCFGPGEIKTTDMILVEMPEGQTFDLTQNMVSVAGTLRVAPTHQAGFNEPIVYRLDADQVEISRTAF